MTHTYRMETLNHVDDLYHTDLHEAAWAGVVSWSGEDEQPTPAGTLMNCYRLTVYDANGNTPSALGAEAIVIYADGGYRLGIAWGGDAEWGDVRTTAEANDDPTFIAAVEEAVSDYLNDADAWEARS